MSTRFIINLILIGVVALFGLLQSQKNSRAFQLLTILILYTFLSEITSRILANYYGIAFPVYHIYVFVGLVFNAFIYQNLLSFNRGIKLFFGLMTICFVLLSLINTLFIQTIFTFPSYGIMLHGLQAILFALIVYQKMLKTPSNTPLSKQAVFWLNTGNFVFYGLTFIVFALYNFYYQTATMSSWVYWLIWCGNIFLYSCYFMAIYLNSKSTNA